MNISIQKQKLLISSLSMVILSYLMIDLVGYGDTSSWTRSAVLNWHQYGFGTLGGKLVTNPGGYEVLTNPYLYKGHSPVCFYPIFLTVKLLGWLGNGILIFHVLFSVLMFLSVKALFGEDRLAWIAAWTVCLCPGYTIYPTIIDPNAIALYSIIPLSVLVIRMLSKDKITRLQTVILGLFIFMYTALNWSTAFGHGILFCTLLVLPKVSRKNVFIYAVLAGLSVAGIAGMAVLEKMNSVSNSPGAGGLQSMLANYTWGNIGYGAHMTTAKAMVRLGVVMGLGMFPIMLLIAWRFFKAKDFKPPMDYIAFFPIIAATLCVLGMRNYFGVHSWMAGPMFLPGFVFSLFALVSRNEENPDASTIKFRSLGFVTACLAYSLLVLCAHRIYRSEALEFTALVLENTKRTDHIVLVESLDPEMASKSEAISQGCDRHVVIIPDLKQPLTESGSHFVLTSIKLEEQLPVLARSKKSHLTSLPIVRDLLSWYALHIAKRSPQERHFDYTAGASFGLYRLHAPTP